MSKPAPSLAPGPFADVSSIAPAGPGRFEAEVHPDWTLGGKPNGGYLLAILGRAAEAAGPHPDVIAASAHYLRSPEPGLVSVEAEVLRAGRGASQVRARMVQRNLACVEALITTSRIDATATPYWDRGLPAMGAVDFRDCVRLVPRTPDGSRVAIMEQIEVRLEPAFETLDRLRGERNFRHQDDGGAISLQGFANCLQINLCFPAAGDAVQQNRFRFLR